MNKKYISDKVLKLIVLGGKKMLIIKLTSKYMYLLSAEMCS